MKSTVLTGFLFLLTGTVANAQLSFLPQVGFEQSKTALNYGYGSSSSLDGNFKAGLKLDYRFKGGHSPFVNITTSPAPVKFSFNNAGSLMDVSQTANDLRLRLEAGYQFTSKPISFGKSSRGSATEASTETVKQYSGCSSLNYRSHCCQRKANAQKSQGSAPLNMRFQPSIALAYIPSNNETVKQTAEGFQYSSATWKTALVPAIGFEFAKGKQRLFTLSVFYTKPLGENEQTVSNFSEAKPVAMNLTPKTSTWGMTIGVPFSFVKSNTVKTKREKREHCNRVIYRRCSRI